MPYLGVQPVTEVQSIADGTIVNADVNSSAGIVKSKLASLGIVNADVDASAAIAQSKLVDIVNADVDASAAIAQSKLVDIVNADVDASAAIAQSKLVDIVNADVASGAAIATSKLSGALTSVASHGLATSATTDTTNASNLASGTVPTARLGSGSASSSTFLSGNQTWAAAGGGKVLQVVQGTSTALGTTNASTFTATGLSVAITPGATSSKILVFANSSLGQYGAPSGASMFRDSTNIGAGAVDNSWSSQDHMWLQGEDRSAGLTPFAGIVLDSPSSTSSITYSLKYRDCTYGGGGGWVFINRSYNNTTSRVLTTITAIELDFS